MKFSRRLTVVVAALIIAVSPALRAGPAEDVLGELQHAWALAKYQTPEKQQQAAFNQLTQQAQAATAKFSGNAAVWVWSGIIRASYAGAKGGLGALPLVKAAKADLEHAIAIDGSVLHGAAYTSLGSLYYQVPGWPLGFGDAKKADEYLIKGLQFGLADMDANYFYADFLYRQNNYAPAMNYLEKALAAPADPERPLADQGRREEIRALMVKVREKIR
jgi:tetratricopeptide (TPR) repeat protein